MSDQLSTVAKTLRVLEAFSYSEPILGVSELARKLDMGKSSVHRALSTLLEHGYHNTSIQSNGTGMAARKDDLSSGVVKIEPGTNTYGNYIEPRTSAISL